MNLLDLSMNEAASAVKAKKISAKELIQHYQARIEKLDLKLNSYVAINKEALKQAEEIDKKISQGLDVGMLAGIPFGIKDMLCTKGMTSTAASKILSNFIPPYDSTVVARLKASGAIILGKLNQDEFAMGSSNETSFYGPVSNPWNLDYVPGGSSGGSAAAQAAKLAMGTIGTDTGGSIRQPASFCGIVGVKPTYGRVSRYGIIAYASSLDQAGPMTSNVSDAALTLDVITGHDPLDSTTAQKSSTQLFQNLSSQIKGMKIGVEMEHLSSGGLHNDVQKSVENSINELKKLGAEIIDISLPMNKFAIPVYYLIASSEASSNLARYDGVKYGYRADFKSLSAINLDDFYSQTRGEGFGKEVIRRIMLGTYCLSSGYFDAYYTKACQVRRLIKNQYDEAFSKCEVILSPVTATPAFKRGDRISDPLAMYLNDIFTTATNLAGLPGMSVPYSLSEDGLPIGIQLTASHFQEQKMLNVGLAIESFSQMKGKNPHVI